MSVHTVQEEEIQGFDKEIDAGAIGLILDNLQKYQYMHPQKSAVREITSNGIDAIWEKTVALRILRGEAKPEDYFLKRDDAVNRDSNFDPKYYNPAWLYGGNYPMNKSNIELMNYLPGEVYVTYEDGGEREKDRLIIEDFGVGLGGSRLEGYFKIGYSSKRNAKGALGKFGVGAKAALSVAPFYTMRTRYNGREYTFNVYPHRIVSITPALNMETGKENGLHMFSNGSRIYFKETKMPNGTRIEIESKKHHKQLYIDAVKSQLLYFDNVVFRIRNEQGGLTDIPIKAKILYEDDHVLLSDNTQFSKPHLLISRVNYGYVDWRELELEDVQGNIAFKVPSEEVEVNPSRESVVWSDFTRSTVVGYFHKVKEAATKLISEQLKVNDFIEWLEACAQINTRYGIDSIIGRMSQLVNLKDLQVAYSLDPTIKYGFKMFDGLKVRVNQLKTQRAGTVTKYKVEREARGITAGIADGLPIYIQHGTTSFKVDMYLIKTKHPNGFITVIDPFTEMGEDGKLQQVKDPKLDYPDVKEYETPKARVEELQRIMKYLRISADVSYYDEVVVPDTFEAKEEEEDEKTVEEASAKEERIKLRRDKGVIPIFTPRNNDSSYIPPKQTELKLYEWQKLEMPVAEIDEWSEEEVFYSNDKDSGLLHLAAMITRPNDKLSWSVQDLFNRYTYKMVEQDPLYQTVAGNYFVSKLVPGTHGMAAARSVDDTFKPTYGTRWEDLRYCHNFFETAGEKPKVKLIKVAQDRTKFFLDFKPIQRFFLDIKNKKLTMSNALIRWNTARLIEEKLKDLRFLQNFERFNSKYCLWYRGLVNYVNTSYRNLKDHAQSDKIFNLKQDTYTNLVDHLDKVGRFQLFVRENPNEPEKIAQLAKDMFNPQQEVTDGLAIDTEFYDRMTELLDFAQPIGTLLNEIGILTENRSIHEDVEAEIRGYCLSKGVTL